MALTMHNKARQVADFKVVRALREGAREFFQAPVQEGLGNSVSRLIGRHKRCKEGTHWNDDKGKCMALPDHVAKASAHAETLGKKAVKDHLSGHNDPGIYRRNDTEAAGKRLRIRHAHTQASDAHSEAHHLAKQAGFHDLAGKHEHDKDAHSEVAFHFVGNPKWKMKLSEDSTIGHVLQNSLLEGIRDLHKAEMPKLVKDASDIAIKASERANRLSISAHNAKHSHALAANAQEQAHKLNHRAGTLAQQNGYSTLRKAHYTVAGEHLNQQHHHEKAHIANQK